MRIRFSEKNKSCGSPNLSWWCTGTKSADLIPDALGPGVHRMEVIPRCTSPSNRTVKFIIVQFRLGVRPAYLAVGLLGIF